MNNFKGIGYLKRVFNHLGFIYNDKTGGSLSKGSKEIKKTFSGVMGLFHGLILRGFDPDNKP